MAAVPGMHGRLLTAVGAMSGLGTTMVVSPELLATIDDDGVWHAAILFALSRVSKLSAAQIEALMPFCEPMLEPLDADKPAAWRATMAVTGAVYAAFEATMPFDDDDDDQGFMSEDDDDDDDDDDDSQGFVSEDDYHNDDDIYLLS
jgi:hypothetical protein